MSVIADKHKKNIYIFPILRGTEYKLNSVFFLKGGRKNPKFPIVPGVVLCKFFIIMPIKTVIIIVMLNRSSNSGLGTGRVAKSKKRRNFFMFFFLISKNEEVNLFIYFYLVEKES